MESYRRIPVPCFGSSSGPGDEGDATGGSTTFHRVRSVGGLLEAVKFEAKKIKEGGKKNIFKQKFEVIEGEKLLKASYCCLSTQAGAVAGLLFISTEKIAFCSRRSITFNLPDGLPNEADEKIEIPLRDSAWISRNDPQQKKIIIRRADGSEFLFMNFLRYEKARQNLQTAILWQSLQS